MRDRTRALTRPTSVRRELEGQDTRRRLLETAGEVFAEKGLDAATAHEICERARVNAAAVNYYFGGIKNLYEAVLIEARGRIPNLSSLSAIVGNNTDVRDKLRAIIGLAVSVLTGPASQSWVLRVLVREAAAPSPVFERLLLESEGSKLRILKSIVAEIMGLPDNHAAVARGCISVFAVCQVMIISDRNMLKRAYPELDLTARGASTLIEQITIFALAGLTAMADAEKGRLDS